MAELTDGMARTITLTCRDCGHGCKLRLIGVPAWNNLIQFCPISNDKKVHWIESKPALKKPKQMKLIVKPKRRETEAIK